MPGFAFSAAFARNLRGGDPLDEDSSFESVPRPARAPPVETAASGTSDFASPRTASSGSTVGGSSADSPVSLVLIGHSNQVCCGVIGNRSKGHFCTALVGTCSTKAHANNKFNVRDASWYARTYGRRGGALLHVSCPDDSVKRPEDREAFLKHEKPIDVWRGIFTAIQTDDAIVINTSSSEGGTDVSEMGSPSPRSVQFTRAATGLETPRPATIGRAVKRRVIRGSVDVSSLETVQDIEYEDGVPIPEGQDWDKAIGTMLAEWSKVGANFEKLKDMFIAMGVEFQDLNDGVVKDFDLIEEHSSLVDGKIHLLKERMGHDSAASDGGSKTVWNAIAELQADLVIHNKMFADLASGLDARFAAAESLSSSVKDLEEDYNASMNNLDLVLAEFNKRVTALERPVKTVVGRFSQGSTSMFTKQDVDNDTINDLKVRIAELERIVSVMKTVQPDANDVKSVRLLGQDLEVLGNRLGKLSTEGRNGEAQRARDWDGGFSDVSGFRRDKRKYGDAASAEDELQEVVEHFRNEINFLRGKVRALETPHRGQTVEFNGRKFTSIDDCREFLRITKLDAGVCLDLLTALLLMGSKGHSGKELSDERYSAKRMDTSVRINDVLAAMDQARPPKLYAKGGKGDCVAHAEGFGAIPSIKDWYGSGVDGIKHNLTTELRSYLNGIMGALNNQSGEGVELARHLNRQVISQWNDFVSFMEQSQTKLVEVAKFSDKAAWKLIGRYGVAFFEAMRPYRSAASLLENPQSLDDQAAILWAILQCHRTVDEFMHVGWEGHPAIVREMSLFMLTERVDPSQVAKVMEQNEALVVQVSSLKSSLKKLEETVTAQKRALDSLSNECSLAKIPVTTDPLQLVGEAHDSPPLIRKDLSSRGLARGVVDSQLRNKLPCVIFGEAYPCWLAFASQLGYDPVLVVLESEDHLATVHASVPDHCAVIASDDWTALVAKLPHFVHRSAIVLVDGRVSQNILDLAELMQVTTVVGTALARRPVKGWHQAVSRIDHSLVGGVTHTQVHVVACTLHGNGTVPTPNATATIPRDLSSVLTDVQGGIPRQAPLHRRLSSGEVVNVRPNGAHPVYHGMGWLPANPKRSTKVLTPSVFVTRGSKWALRSITDVEFLAIYDYPERLVEILLPKLEDKSFPNLQPGKALLTGACSVLNQLSKLVNEGGGNFLSPPLISHKRRFHEIVLPDSEPQPQSKASKTGNSAVMEVNPLPSSIPSIGLVEVSSILDEVSKDKRERKATKADDAEVPISMWTDHYLEESTLKWNSSDKSSIEKAMDTMRKYLLERWKRRVLNSYLKWYYEEGRRPRCQACEHWVEWTRKDEEDDNKERVEYRWTNQGRFEYAKWYKERKDGDPLELEAGSDAVCRALLSSWWEWEDGSRPFHWRWPAWYRRSIRDGLEVFLDGDPPVYTKAQRKEKDPKIRDEMIKKLAKVRARRYIAKGTVVSLTSYFAVPKGESDIRMVYDGTKSGLNDAMWVPRFGLPTIDTHLRSIEEGTFLADVDVGECFLNFPLHHSLRKLAGVDFTHYFPDPSKSKVWECWHRALMGCKSSPFQAVQGMTVAEEVIRGQPEDPHNVFRWSQVRLNLPGDPSYDPSKPWVSKVREEETIAADLVGYVDDLRTSGPDRKEAWHAAKRTASVLNYLGIQDAPRKRRDSSRTPGAWSGSVVVTKDDGVYVTADSEKWNKAKGMVEEVIAMIAHDRKRLNRKRLEEIRGFLNYVVRTYPALKPYLTGLHLTIDGWRADRDPEGWRLKNRKGKRKIWNGINSASFSSEKFLSVASNTAPTEVEAKERLPQDMLALRYLMEGSSPLLRRVRSRIGRTVVYSFGDASSSGFGITLEVEGKIYYEYGQWDESADGQSSNWREATNLLEGLRRAIHDHALEGLEVFIFTDNTTAESTYWKGWSRDKALSDIVLEMRKLEMEHDIVLHIIHVSGSRMIRQGTDGLSRADHSNGVMNGEDMTRHVPLNESAFERSPELLHRFNTMFPGLELQLLEPRAWYDEYHNYGNFVWCPPPAAADVVVDLLNKARHKRPESMHIILVPRLMTGNENLCWTKWEEFCCNPSCTKRVTVRSGIFCGNFCVARGPYAPCRQAFCAECFNPLGYKPFLIRQTLDDEGVPLPDKESNRFVKARPGDMLMCPFQCEVCHFRNIMKRDPMTDYSKDFEIMEYMRRANLDAFWARESSTVTKNLALLLRAESCFGRLDLPPAVSLMGPFPLSDTLGMQAAIAVLDKSLDKGKYEAFVQWETFRKMRSAITNLHQARVDGMGDVVMSYEKEKLWVSTVQTHTFYFSRFMTGLHKRVGEVVKQDWPVPIEVMQYIDRNLNRLWNQEADPAARKCIAEMGTWFVGGFCTGLRGEEMLLIELRGTADSLQFLTLEVDPHFLFRMKGRTKGCLLAGKGFDMPCLAVTGVSKLKPGRWIRRLVTIIENGGRRNGKLFLRDLQVARLVEFEEDFFDVLLSVQSSTELIDKGLDLREKAGILRTLRRGLTSHAINMEVPTTLTEAINRWRNEHKENGAVVTYKTIDHYAQLDTLKPTFLKFSKAL